MFVELVDAAGGVEERLQQGDLAVFVEVVVDAVLLVPEVSVHQVAERVMFGLEEGDEIFAADGVGHEFEDAAAQVRLGPRAPQGPEAGLWGGRACGVSGELQRISNACWSVFYSVGMR